MSNAQQMTVFERTLIFVLEVTAQWIGCMSECVCVSVPSPSSWASSSLPLTPDPSISSSSAADGALASSFWRALPLRLALRSFSYNKHKQRHETNTTDSCT